MKLPLFVAFLSASAGAAPIPEGLGKAAIADYSKLVFASYAEAVTEAQTLAKALDALVSSPTEANLEAARTAWKNARDAYGPTEPFRFYGGPIDDPKTGPEGLINAWPIDEAYIDYVNGNPAAGIVANAKEFPAITKDLLLAANAKGGERNVSTGYHAIEFLLWGQDLSSTGPGARPATDYDPAKSKTAARRGVYLRLLGSLLVDHLSSVRDAWDPAKGAAYPKAFAAEPLDESLRKVFTGMTNLSIDEMSGERMTVALEKSDQENEQDCFSDYTLNDLRSNERGIHRLYFETGLEALVRAVDPATAKKVAMALKSALAALEAIPAPYDNVIASKKGSKGRKAAEKAIALLQDQGKFLAQAGKKMGLVLNVQ